MVLPRPPEQELVPEEAPFYATTQELAPPWLQDPVGGVPILFVLGIHIDASLEYIRLGVLQRFPTAQVPRHPGQYYANPEAVVAVGQDRQIARGQFEPDASYRERVRQARTTWRLAGNANTLLRQIWAYFLPTPPQVRYVVNGVTAGGTPFADWTTISPAGAITRHRAQPNNWDWDGEAGHVRFWVIVYLPLTSWYWGATPTGSGLNWGGGQNWGFVESNAWVKDVRQIISKWKAAGSHAGVLSMGCDGGLVAALDPLAFDPSYPPGGVPGYPMPDGDWDDWAQRDNAIALYLSGV